MVGVVVDGLEVGGLAGLDVPVTGDGDLGSVVDNKGQTANRVAAFGVADIIEDLGLGGRGCVGFAGEGPEVAVAGMLVVVLVGFVLDDDMEGGNGVVALSDGPAALIDEGGVSALVEVFILVVEGEVVSVADGGIDFVSALTNLGILDGEDEGMVGAAVSVTVGGVEGNTVGVGVIDSGTGEVGGVFLTGIAYTGVEAVAIYLATFFADGG